MGAGSRRFPFAGLLMTPIPHWRPSCLTQTSRVRSCERHPNFTRDIGIPPSVGSGPSTRKSRSEERAVILWESPFQMISGKMGSQAWLPAIFLHCRSERVKKQVPDLVGLDCKTGLRVSIGKGGLRISECASLWSPYGCSVLFQEISGEIGEIA